MGVSCRGERVKIGRELGLIRLKGEGRYIGHPFASGGGPSEQVFVRVIV